MLKGWRSCCKRGLFDTTYIIDLFKHDRKAIKKAAEIDADLVKKGEMIAFPDIVIAAIALTYDLILVTRDGHFKRIEGLKVEGY